MKRIIFGMAAAALLAGLTSCAGTPRQEPRIARITPEELARLAPASAPHLSLDEIVALAHAGTPPAAIIQKIRDSGSRYRLTPADIVELAGKGVSLEVIDFMVEAEQQALRDAMAEEMNQRDRKRQEEIQRLQRELSRRPTYYEPWPYPPYWHDPFYRPYWYR